MTRFKYYVIELLTMPKIKTLKEDLAAVEEEACGLDGGICDQCGCQFATTIGKAHHCPNCGSKRWDHVTTDKPRRLGHCQPWVMEKVKKGKSYQYWVVSWREGGKVRNVHLGSCKKLDKEAAMQKALAIKKAALGIDPQ